MPAPRGKGRRGPAQTSATGASRALPGVLMDRTRSAGAGACHGFGRSAYSRRDGGQRAPQNLRPSAPARHRRAAARRDPASFGSRRQLRRARPPGRQEAVDPARPHPDQSVLRKLDAHAHLVRAGRQAAGRGRGQHVGRLVLDQEGRDPDRHRHDLERDASGRAGGAPPGQRGGRVARPPRQLRRDQRRRRQPRASDPGAARCAHHPPAQRAASRA